MADLRTPVMIRVEVSWFDHTGVFQAARGCIEDKSTGGACVRVKLPIDAGSKLSVRGPWEQFSGTAKYCRGEGREYVIGIQRDATNTPPPPAQAANPPVLSSIPTPGPVIATPLPVAAMEPQDLPKPLARNRVEMFPTQPEPENSYQIRLVSNASMPPPRGFGRKTANRERPPILQPQISSPSRGSYARAVELQATQPLAKLGAGNERKSMSSKWFGMSPRQNKREDHIASDDEISNATEPRENFMPPVDQPTERAAAQSSRSVPSFQVQLLPVEDIYRAAGIITPPKGYSVNKVVEMLRSEHIRSLSPEMKRAAVLMALDAAGVPLAQVQLDAKARQEALDSYEVVQTQQVDAEWARKAEEVSQIQAELESIKAHYQARITRNLEGVAREKATFSTWQTMKQQEVESMAEAAELCSKAMASKAVQVSPPAAPPEASSAATAGTV